MKKILETVRNLFAKLRRYVSPVFVMLLVASFMLWYISKLNYTYTAEFDVKVNVDGERITVPCVVEGLGTNLLGYFFTARKINIPPSELQFDIVREAEPATEPDAEPTFVELRRIRPASLQNAISVRFSDIKIISVGNVPDMKMPEK